MLAKTLFALITPSTPASLPSLPYQNHSKMAEMTLSDRLQALLTTARDANLAEPNRMPLEEFLAGLQQDATELGEQSSQQTEVSEIIC